MNELAGKMFDALEAAEQPSPGDDPEVLLREGRTLAQRGQTDRAIEKFETLIRLHPEEARGHNDLGNLCCLKKDIEKALLHLEQAVQLQPNVLPFLKDLADAYLAEAANLSEALKIYKRVLSVKPDDVDTLLRIGNICAAQQQFDHARLFYGRVLFIEPGNKQAEENLKVLQGMVEGQSFPEGLQPNPWLCQSPPQTPWSLRIRLPLCRASLPAARDFTDTTPLLAPDIDTPGALELQYDLSKYVGLIALRIDLNHAIAVVKLHSIVLERKMLHRSI